MNKKFKDYLVFLIPIGLILISVIFIYVGQNSNNLSADQVADKAINYLNDSILPTGTTASLIDIVEEGEVYKIRIEVNGTEYQSYVSKDGKYLFPDAYALDVELESQEQLSQDISERERPDVKLFVMSYCPYGLQAQKMYLPVYNLLSNKVDMGVYFVNYIMHEKGEIDENLIQYCIQKEQMQKYDEYLSCFVKDGDSKGCLLESGVNENSLLTCTDDTDKEFNIYTQYQDKDTWLEGIYPRFDVHDGLNQSYEIGGSPTIVINDTVIVSNESYCPQGDIKCSVIPDFVRSPERFKELICQSFTTQPEECSQILSNTAYAPGFGLEGNSASSDQGCSQ